MNFYIPNNNLLFSKKSTVYPIGNNSANFALGADWNGLDGNVTTVGSNGGPSAYGTYDQGGNAMEWVEEIFTSGATSYRRLRGGAWDTSSTLLNSQNPAFYLPTRKAANIGIRIFSYNNPNSYNNFLYVGDINNNSNTIDLRGSVSYSYMVNKYEITNQEYVTFLNSIAATDTYGLYSTAMSTSRGGILRSGSSGSYVYTTVTNMDNKPVVFTSWYDNARYCNWLHNGKPTGLQNNTTTEDGAYTLSGNTGFPSRNVGSKYFIATTNEWYKSAYYKGGSTNAGYWFYPTQNDSVISPVSATINGDGTL
jgi:formylglycine-generating enzyme required for sulfatase activity